MKKQRILSQSKRFLYKHKISFIVIIISIVSAIGISAFFKGCGELYTIQFESNGGSIVENQNVKNGSKIFEPVLPIKKGFTFVAWQLDGKTFDFESKVNSNAVLTALWKPNKETIICLVSLDNRDEKKIKIVEVSKGEKMSPPIIPIKKGYIFAGWYYLDVKFDFNSAIIQDITLNANWIKNSNNSYIEISSINNEAKNEESNSYNGDNDDGETSSLFQEKNVVKVEGINIECPDGDLPVGQSETLIANIIPTNATNKNVEWHSSNSSIVNYGWQADNSNMGTINASGVGTAIITAKTIDGSYSASCTIRTLSSVVTGLTLSSYSADIEAKTVLVITPTIVPSYAYNSLIYWSSSDSSIATVTNMSHSGRDVVITGISPGSAIITARTSDGNYTKTVEVEVKKVDVKKISIENCPLNMYVGNTYSLTAKIDPFYATNTDVVWSTKYPSMATISPEGLIKSNNSGKSIVIVTPIKSIPYNVGVVTVTTVDGGKSASCTFGIPLSSE